MGDWFRSMSPQRCSGTHLQHQQRLRFHSDWGKDLGTESNFGTALVDFKDQTVWACNFGS